LRVSVTGVFKRPLVGFGDLEGLGIAESNCFSGTPEFFDRGCPEMIGFP